MCKFVNTLARFFSSAGVANAVTAIGSRAREPAKTGPWQLPVYIYDDAGEQRSASGRLSSFCTISTAIRPGSIRFARPRELVRWTIATTTGLTRSAPTGNSPRDQPAVDVQGS